MHTFPLTHWLPCRPKPAVTSLDLTSTSDVITFDQIGIIYAQLLQEEKIFPVMPSDQPNGARDMHKIAQKVERKTQTKISCHYTWLLLGKNCLPRWRFLRSFLTASKPIRRSITAAERKEKKKKERRKKIPKIEKPYDVGHFLVQKRKILISAHARVKMS